MDSVFYPMAYWLGTLGVAHNWWVQWARTGKGSPTPHAGRRPRPLTLAIPYLIRHVHPPGKATELAFCICPFDHTLTTDVALEPVTFGKGVLLWVVLQCDNTL